MKIKIKFDLYSKKQGSPHRASTYENAFIELNLDYFRTLHQIFKMFPVKFPDINSYACSQKNKSGNEDKHPCENLFDTEGVLPANGHDIFNYVARFGSANYQIQAIMKLDGRLDPVKLTKALKLSADAEPVFGCRFIENQPPYWKHLDDIDSTMFCTFDETDNIDEAVRIFLESPLDMDNDPMIKMKLIRSPQNDTLCLKINHTCCDGTGTKEYIQLLSEIYTHLEQGKGMYVCTPKTRNRNDQDKLFDTLGIKDPEAAWTGQLDDPKNMWPFPWQQGKHSITHSLICKLPYGALAAMHTYAKPRGATINDLLVTALYRAMFKISQPQQGIPMSISMTADLRRYIPGQKTEAIRNFSGGFDTKLVMINGESFEETLSRVIPMMTKAKNNNPGLQSAIGLERVEKTLFYEILSYYKSSAENNIYTDKCSPVLSNLGFISKKLVKFGDTPVTDAFIVPPAVCAPGILLCIGTYNEVVTLAVSYYESQISASVVNRLLDAIKDEILTGVEYRSYL